MEHLELISLCSIGYLMEAITNYDYIKERFVMFRCRKCNSAFCSNDCDYEQGLSAYEKMSDTDRALYDALSYDDIQEGLEENRIILELQDKEPPIECPGDYRCECDYESEDKE